MTAAPTTPSGVSRLRRRPRLAWERSYTAAILVIVLVVVYVIQSNGLSSIAALGIANVALPLALVAVAETFVILTNGLDLSVGSMLTLGNVTLAWFVGHGHPTSGVLLGLAIGAGAGLINGLIVNYMRIAPLIATLATMSIYLGIALIIMPIPLGQVGDSAPFPSWLSSSTAGQIGPLPVAVIWLAVAIVVGWLLLRRTAFGINLQALGGSEAASWEAGINVGRTRILAYVASGIRSALGGIVLGGLTETGDATVGSVYLLEAIAAMVVGGTALSGGIGTLAGSVLGAIVLSLVFSVLLASGLDANYQYIVSGAIVIGMLFAHSLQSRLGEWSLRRARRPTAAVEQVGA
jgi:ribose transport system permease protein